MNSRALEWWGKYFDILIIDLCTRWNGDDGDEREETRTQCDNLIESKTLFFTRVLRSPKCLIHLNNLLIHTFYRAPKHTLALLFSRGVLWTMNAEGREQ